MEVGLEFGYALAALVSSLATIATVWFKGKIKERKNKKLSFRRIGNLKTEQMYSDLNVTEEGMLVFIVTALLLYMLTYLIENKKQKYEPFYE